jgi:hypothetical protein
VAAIQITTDFLRIPARIKPSFKSSDNKKMLVRSVSAVSHKKPDIGFDYF